MTTRQRQYFWQDDDPLWYKDAIIYELHVRAFYDTNGDGIGDFEGLTAKLDYLRDLGVTAIWLLPFYPSPLRDDGYDISDYTSIHPSYGTLRDFRALVRAADERGLRIITELVVNHTSDQHPWFQRARRASPGMRQRDFYVWSETPEKYKEARIIFKDFERSNWTYDAVVRQYFWHRFYSHQPDLNYDNPAVRNAIFRVMSFWFNLGVSGLRLDAVPYLFERDGTNCENLPETHAFLKVLRTRLDSQFRNRMLLAEANQWSEDAAAYFGEGDECHVAYHFPLMPRMFMAIRMEDRFPIVDILEQTPKIPDSCQWAIFLRNHDELTLEMVTDEERDFMYRVYAQDRQARINLGIRRRLAPLLNNDRKKMELMQALVFSLPGTPMVYYGDEIGMGDNYYLGDRNGVRTPMQWSGDRNAGFSTANPHRLYLPVNIDPEYHYETLNVDAQQNNPDSFLWWMKRLIALRKRYRAFGRGTMEMLYPDNRKVLAFIRRHGEETLLVIANLSRHAQHCSVTVPGLAGGTPVELFGHNEFPSLTESPYPLALGPYGFYWFALEPAKGDQASAMRQADQVASIINLRRGPEDVLRKTFRPRLGTALQRYARRSRWFGGKARRIRTSTVEDIVPVESLTTTAYLVVVRIDYTEGESQSYLVPICIVRGERATQLHAESPQSVVATLETRADQSDTPHILIDALALPEFREMLLNGIARRRSFRGESGEISFHRTRAVFTRARGPISEPLESIPLKAQQSNSSVAYSDRFMLKLYRRLEDGMSPELEIGRFLTERQPHTNAPRVAGAIEYSRGVNTEPITLGVLHTYVRNEGDAWQYTLDTLDRYFDHAQTILSQKAPAPLSRSLLQISQEEMPDVAVEAIGPYLESARVLGQRTAELHLALASAVEDESFAPEEFSAIYQRSLYHGNRAYAVQVLNALRGSLQSLPSSVQSDAEAVLAQEGLIADRFQAVTRRKMTAMRIRCHGDFHLGQVLHTGSDFVIIDFEGEPTRSLGERRIKHSPLKDVAGMIRSFGYASHVALHGEASAVIRSEDIPRLNDWAQTWFLWVAGIYLRAYLNLISDAPILPAKMEDVAVILDSYLLQKALYEVAYELNNRPDWLHVPLRGIRQVLETLP
ncbi:maltose alpha-D-glucosyltransferase [Chloroflexota bacterium]